MNSAEAFRLVVPAAGRDAASEVSGIFESPATPRALATLAHGAGAGLDHATMAALAQGLVARGVAVARFNFPFKEAGRARVDSVAVSTATIEAAIGWLRSRFEEERLPLFVCGHSFGGRMGSHLPPAVLQSVSGLVFFAFPLHPAGKPSVKRAEHLPGIDRPMLFLSGTRDALGTEPLLEETVAGLGSGARLYRVHDADHSYKARKRERGDREPVLEEMLNVAADFILAAGDDAVGRDAV